MIRIIIFILCSLFSMSIADSHNTSVSDALKSVVGIQVRQLRPLSSYLNEHRSPANSSAGSGVIINSKGLILTNRHVIKDQSQIIVTLDDGHQEFAQLIGKDDRTDLALIQIVSKKIKTTPIKLSKTAPKVGEAVIAIGNPLGLHQSVTSGIVSSLHRKISLGHMHSIQDFIQTDAPINPGNSGGALVNQKGELIGINTANISSKTSGNSISGIGFAIPNDIALPIAHQLLKHGHVSPSMLGVEAQPISSSLKNAFDLDSSQGALISKIFNGSNAERSGLKSTDVIIKIDNIDIYDPNHLATQIYTKRVNSKIKVTYIRNKNTKSMTITLKPSQQLSKKSKPRTLAGVVTENFDQLDVNGSKLSGVRVLYVDPMSKAFLNGLQPGDILLEIDHKLVSNLDELKNLTKNQTKNLFKIKRGDHIIYIAITL